jgi:four helix bundle protein
MHNFRNLHVYPRARAAAIEVYRVTRSFPSDERFGMISQIRRAAVSVGANVVEGSKRTNREFAHFLQIAEGSAAEVWFMLDVAIELGFGDASRLEALQKEYVEIEMMLRALRAQLK